MSSDLQIVIQSQHFSLLPHSRLIQQWQIDNIFLIFPRKQDLTFHANCLHWRQFAWTVKSCFPGKIRKIFQYAVWKFYPECLIIFASSQIWVHCHVWLDDEVSDYISDKCVDKNDVHKNDLVTLGEAFFSSKKYWYFSCFSKKICSDTH